MATLHSWTVKLLSLAGKVRLIASVIYGMVNFWSAVFVLPKSFYAKVDSLCAAFLWKNKTSSASGTRVAWEDVCKPKSEGGSGIRLLEEFEMVFRLKQLSNFFTNSGSIWVAWLKRNVFRRSSYWLTEESYRFSGTVRSMIQLRDSLVDFLRCKVCNGETVLFWFMHWTELGPLLQFIGQNGPRSLRIRKDACVIDATRNGFWYLPAARSPEMEALQVALTDISPPHASKGNDVFLWRQANGTYGTKFSSKATWEYLRNRSPTVFWHKTVWFKEHIPRNAFMAWLALLRRLPTKDRLRRWGLNVAEVCVLCNTGIETHHHLFFECDYSQHIWQSFASRVWPNPPSDLHSVAAWINQPRAPSNALASSVIKFYFQSVVYVIWRERNARVFTATSTPPTVIHASLDRMMHDRLLSYPARSSSSSLLLFYLSCIRPP